MRLAISNIAWSTNEDEAVAKLLQRFNIDAIDVAPGKYFPDPTQAAGASVEQVKNWWRERGIEITGMQALLFGASGLNIFGTAEVQDAMLRHLTAICRIAAGLGATRLTFGSPKNRDRTGLNDQEAKDIAVPFFQRLGDIAKSYGATICLEPNPTCYGANFMVTSAETAQMVQQVAHPAIRMQLDTGALIVNGEDLFAVLQYGTPLIGHIHASEPNLVPLGDSKAPHMQFAKLLQQTLPRHIVTIEMLAIKNGSSIEQVERALKYATHNYRLSEC